MTERLRTLLEWWRFRYLEVRCFRHQWEIRPHSYESGYCLDDGYRECARCGVFGFIRHTRRCEP